MPIVGAAVLLSAYAASRTTSQSSRIDAEYCGPPLDRIAVVALFDTRADGLAFETALFDDLLAMNLLARMAAATRPAQAPHHERSLEPRSTGRDRA